MSREPFHRIIRQHPLETVLCVILVAIVSVTFTQVVFRYVLQASLSWSEEVARFLLMWLASLSAAYAFKTRSHFALRFVVDALPKAIQRAVATGVMLLTATFLVVFTRQAWSLTLEVRDMTAPATQLSMAVPYSSALVGGVLMLYYVVRVWWDDRREEARATQAHAEDSSTGPPTEVHE